MTKWDVMISIIKLNFPWPDIVEFVYSYIQSLMLILACTNNLHVPKVFKIMKWPQSNQPHNYFYNINYVCRRNMKYKKSLKKHGHTSSKSKVYS